MSKTVAVTSGTRGVGKTASVGALGTVLADTGHDVLLIDCDFAAPSLADSLGIDAPAITIQDVIAGQATRRDALDTGPSGVSVVSGESSAAPDPDPERLAEFVDGFDAFDVVICDTGHPYSDATAGVLSAADGVVVVSTPDDAARRNTATLHKSLREGDGAPLLGTVLTRVVDTPASEGWDCEVLASIPESNTVASGSSFVLAAPGDPASVAYRKLASDVVARLRAGPHSSSSDRAMWLSPPSGPFVTPYSTMFTPEDEADGTSSSTERHEQAGPSPVDDAADCQTNSPDAEVDEHSDDEDEGGIWLTRRGALAAITAAVGGVSAGILNTSETPEIEAFGYGGAPVSSNESATASATNSTTSAGSLPTAGVTRTEPTNETEDGGSGEDLIGNDTETEETGNTTAPENVSNTTETEAELTPDAEPTPEDGETASDTEESPTTSGGGGNTGTGSGTDTGGDGSSDGETETGDGGGGSGDTTDDPAGPGDGQFGTVSYGQGGYGGVA